MTNLSIASCSFLRLTTTMSPAVSRSKPAMTNSCMSLDGLIPRLAASASSASLYSAGSRVEWTTDALSAERPAIPE